MSTGDSPAFDPARYPSLAAALKVDTTPEELVSVLLVAMNIDPAIIGGAGATSQTVPLLDVLQTIASDYDQLRDLRQCEGEYHRVIDESMKKGRVVLDRIPLWIVQSHTGKLTHGTGYLLDKYQGGHYLVESGQTFDIKPGGAGYPEVVLPSAAEASEYLERWCKQKRDHLNEAYRALAMLVEEGTPEATKVLTARAAR